MKSGKTYIARKKSIFNKFVIQQWILKKIKIIIIKQHNDFQHW